MFSSIMTAIVFVLAVIFITRKITKDRDGDFVPDKKRVLIAAVGFIAYLLLVLPSFGTISTGDRGIVLRFGAVTGRIIEPGLYFVVPLIENVKDMSVQVKAEEAEASAASKDLQGVTTKITLNYAVGPAAVVTIYSELGDKYVDRIIKPAIQETVKATTAQFNAEELVTRRSEVKTAIEKSLSNRLNEHGIDVEEVNITDFSFSEEFSRAVEEKVKASQQALKAKNDLDRIKTEAEQAIVIARAEADSLKLKKEQVTPELIKLKEIENRTKEIENQKEALKKWNGVLPTYVSSGGIGTPVPVLDLLRSQEK